MQRLGLEDVADAEIQMEAGFWKRQFQTATTASQKEFDWLFGVILPIVCFVFDPIVFTRGGVFEEYKAFAYILSFVSVMSLAAWLIWGAKLKWLNGFLAGFFAVVSFISLGIGIVIFPFSLLGLVVLIGVLGFTPLFCAVVFLRNSMRAYRAAKPFFERRVLAYSFLLSALFSIVTPSVINVEVNKLVKKNADNSVLTRILFD